MTSTTDIAKFQETICSFANDMPGSRKKGYLLIGLRNDVKAYAATAKGKYPWE